MARAATLMFPWPGKGRTARAVITACWHIGHPKHHAACLANMVQRVKKLGTAAVVNGDTIEAITPDDKRYDVTVHTPKKENPFAASIIAQMADVRDILARLREKGRILVTSGNHEWKVDRLIGDVLADACRVARVEYFGAHGKIVMTFPEGEKSWHIYHTRRIMNIRTGTAKERELKRIRRLRQDWYHYPEYLKIGAHLHRAVVCPSESEQFLTAQAGGLPKMVDHVVEPTWIVHAPSMFKTYDYEGETDNYASRAGYEPSEIGWMEVVFGRDGAVQAVEQMNEHGKAVRTWEHSR